MTSPTDPASDDRFVPTTRTHDASAGRARLCCGRLLSCVVAFLGGLLTWGMLQAFFPVFDIPIELQNLPTPPPGDSAARQQQAYVVAERWNATLTLAILGLTMGGMLAIAESALGRRGGAAWWRVLPSALLSGLLGAAAGLSASLLLESPQATAGMSPLAKTILVQCLGVGLLGLGVGSAVGITVGDGRLLLNLAVGGTLGGLIAGFLYPAGTAYLLPNAQTEHAVPIETATQFVWVAASSLCSALVIASLGTREHDPPRPS